MCVCRARPYLLRPGCLQKQARARASLCLRPPRARARSPRPGAAVPAAAAVRRVGRAEFAELVLGPSFFGAAALEEPGAVAGGHLKRAFVPRKLGQKPAPMPHTEAYDAKEKRRQRRRNETSEGGGGSETPRASSQEGNCYGALD